MTDIEDPPYSANGGFAPMWFRWFAILATLLFAGLKLTGFLATPWALAFLPMLISGALLLLHHCIRSATHAAIRMAHIDAALDEVVIKQTQHIARHTLTPLVLTAALEESRG